MNDKRYEIKFVIPYEQVISGLVLESKIRDGRLGYKHQFKINDSSSSLLSHKRV